MTNREMIEKLEQDGLSNVSDMDFIIDALEENDKLKSEIEQLRIKETGLETIIEIQERTIQRLESELKQSVKLPCKVGDMVYVIDKCDKACSNCSYRVFNKPNCINELNARIFASNFRISMLDCFGKTIFLTREEAEQALKGKVEE